jgi:uncharacterized protein YkuJ
MKKFFTLIACALVAGSAFAQETVVNAKFSSKSNENADEMAPFKSTEWIDGVQVAVVQSRVVVDPTTGYTEGDEGIPRSTNRCIEVISRDAPVNEETGEAESINDWDTQFFIQVPEIWPAGTEYTVKFRYRAEKPASAQTQAHALPSKYNAHGILGDISFTEEWQDFEQSGTLTAGQAEGNGGKFQSFAFNLAVLKEANKYYFDDISITAKMPRDPNEMTWYNLVYNGNCEGDDGSSLVCREYYCKDTPNFVDGVGVDGSRAAVVNTFEENIQVEEDTQPAYNQSWAAQFFITQSHVFAENESFRIEFDYRAEKPATVETQAHTAPGAYKHYQCMGNVSFTEEWQHMDKVVTVDGSMATMTTIAFNLQKVGEANVFYFDNVKMSINEDIASDEEKAEAGAIATGINSAKAAKAAKAIYNVAGQQLKSLQKGLNIVNGEKVYVK